MCSCTCKIPTAIKNLISSHEPRIPKLVHKLSTVCPSCGFKYTPTQSKFSVLKSPKIEPVPLPAGLHPTLLLDNSPTPQILLSDNDAVVYANKSATRLLSRQVAVGDKKPSTNPPPDRSSEERYSFASMGSQVLIPVHDSGIEGLFLDDLPIAVARSNMQKWISLEQVFKVVKKTILRQKDQDLYDFDTGAYSEYYDTGTHDDDYYGKKEIERRAQRKEVDEYSRNEMIPVIITKQDRELMSASLYISLIDSVGSTSFTALSFVPNSTDVDASFYQNSRRASDRKSTGVWSDSTAGRDIVEKVAMLKDMILDEMEYSFACITLNGDIVITNKACRKLLGEEVMKSPAASEGYDWISQLDFWRPDFSERLPFEEWCITKVFTTKKSASSTVGLLQGDEKHIFDTKGTPLWKNTKKEEGLLAGLIVFVEQTERANREREILRSGNVRKTFLVNLSRGLKTPIAGIMALLELLYEIETGKEQRTLVRNIFSSVNSLRTLLHLKNISFPRSLSIDEIPPDSVLVINDLIDFNKIEADDLQIEENIFVLQHLIEDVETLFQESMAKKGVVFRIDTTEIISSAFGDGTKLLLKGDDGKIRRIVINLLSNAYRFTPRGTVTLKVITQKVQKGSLELRFEINDTGIGISEEDMRKFFLTFHEIIAGDISKGNMGTGFGLSIAKSLVTLMRGDIGCRSVVDKGSTFWFSLPCTRPPQDTPVTIPRKENSLSHNMGVALRIDDLESAIIHDGKKEAKVVIEGASVLIVEDNWSHQVVMQKRLEKMGCSVQVAVNGQNAISRMRKEEFKVDIIFMDLQMPLLDGYETTAMIRKAEDKGMVAYKEVPIIAVTATEMLGDRDRAREAGMNDFTLKPLHKDSLKQIMERFLDPTRKAEDFREDSSVESFKPRNEPAPKASPEESLGLKIPIDTNVK